jgi:hypothetical protein
MSSKALEMEYLFPYGGFVREPGGKAPTMRALERYVMEGSVKGAFLL